MEELNVIQTIVGLGPSGILALIAWKLWGEYKEQVNYNRDQDKLNLEHSQRLLSLLDKIYDKQGAGDDTTHSLIKEMRAELKELRGELTKSIADLIINIQNYK